MSNLVEHAKRELEALGQTKEDPAFAASIIKAVEGFVTYGHSGGSHSVAVAMLTELLNFHNIAPLTDDPDEWYHHGEDVWGEPGGIWQNKRNGEAFSKDGGKTYYLLSERRNPGGLEPMEVVKYHTSRDHTAPISADA